MQRCPESGALAGRPNSPAEGCDRIRAPVQANPVIRVLRLRGVALVEHALEVATGDSDAVVPAMQMQLLALVLANDLGADAQQPAVAAGVAHRVRRVDDEILQHQSQHRARHAYGADLPQRIVGVDLEALAAGVGDDLEGLVHELGETHGLDDVLVARRMHQFVEGRLHQGWPGARSLRGRAAIPRPLRISRGIPNAGTASDRAYARIPPAWLRASEAPPRTSMSSAEAAIRSSTGAVRSRSPSFATRTASGVIALPRLCSTPFASSAKPAWKD